jgi:hypothetical protein
MSQPPDGPLALVSIQALVVLPRMTAVAAVPALPRRLA